MEAHRPVEAMEARRPAEAMVPAVTAVTGTELVAVLLRSTSSSTIRKEQASSVPFAFTIVHTCVFLTTARFSSMSLIS